MTSGNIWPRTAGNASGIKPDVARLAAVALILIIAVLDAANLRGLYADGANFLVHMLSTRSFMHVNLSRRCVELLTQFPMIAALWSGITNLQVLIYLDSALLVLMPVAFWTIALVRLYRDDAFWPLFVLFCIVYFNVGFFAIGEFNVAYSLVALSLAILSGRSEIGPGWAVTALFAALCLVAAYEAMVFLGPLLCVIAGARMRMEPQPEIVRTLLILCVALYLAGALVAGVSILHPRDPGSFAGAIDVFGAVHNRLLALSVAFAIGCVVSLAPAVWARRAGQLLAIGCLIAIVLPSSWSLTKQHYQARTLTGIVIFGYGSLVVVRWMLEYKFPAQLARARHMTATYPLMLFLALSVSDVTHSLQYGQYLAQFRTEVRSRSGLVPLEETRLLAGDTALYGWGWTYPLMSLLLRDDANQAIILNAKGFTGYQPFDPHETVPDLRAYYHS